ncbi:MAG: hypothetical protein WC241_00715 [Candidatus Paceibacterota bacterium]|jgi:hypothetical protein
MQKEENNKNVERLLMALLVTRGISTSTLGKIMGMSQQNVSKVIPVSDIQKDIKNNYGKK